MPEHKTMWVPDEGSFRSLFNNGKIPIARIINPRIKPGRLFGVSQSPFLLNIISPHD